MMGKKPYCQCKHEDESGLPRTKYCFMACPPEPKRQHDLGLIVMPEHIHMYNGSWERCDMLIGPCSCGAWHGQDCWDDKIPDVQQYL